MYAYVRYVADNVRKIIPTQDIEDFHPKNLHDFKAKKRYRVLWKRTPQDKGSYYDAQILKLADNEKEFGRGRISVPPVESEDDEPAIPTSPIKRKEKKRKLAEARKVSLLEIMKEKKENIMKKREREESDEEVSVPLKQLYKELQEKYTVLKKKYQNNEIIAAENQKLQEQIKKQSDELETLRSLNLRFQQQLFSTPEVIKQSGSRETSLDAEPEVIAPEQDEDGKLKLGPGVSIDKKKWQHVQEEKSHSRFCKSLAVAIWGTEVLMERSVTGAKSNAAKHCSVPKPPLTPEKLKIIRECLRDRLRQQGYPPVAIDQQMAIVRRSISEKMCDIRKKVSQTEEKTTPSSNL